MKISYIALAFAILAPAVAQADPWSVQIGEKPELLSGSWNVNMQGTQVSGTGVLSDGRATQKVGLAGFVKDGMVTLRMLPETGQACTIMVPTAGGNIKATADCSGRQRPVIITRVQ